MATRFTPAKGRVRTGPPACVLVAIAGAAIFVLGVLGFVPALTSGPLGFWGPGSTAELFGVFRVSGLLNLVHVLFGLTGLVAARNVPSARIFLLLGGATSIALSLYGALVPPQSHGNVLALNDADNGLHLFLGIAMMLVGLLTTRGPASHGQVEPAAPRR